MATPSGPSLPAAAVSVTSKLNAALVKRSMPPSSSPRGRAAGRLDLGSAAPHGAAPGASGGDRLRRSGGRPCDPGALADAIDLTRLG